MEEISEHPQLLQLEAATLADVDQFGACSLTDKARVQKLSLSIQGKLSQIRALTRDLELLVEELDSDEERQEVEALLAQHKAEYARIQAAFKQAALSQRTLALRSAAEERRELLTGGDAATRQRKLQTEADTVTLAEDVTGGLRRTRQVLAEELEHTGATLAAMEASHSQLAKTGDEYRGQHGRLKRSKGLLRTLNWQAKSETYMLWFGLSLFVLVCAYIFQKRAGHFVPDRLKPAALLRATGLTGRSLPTPVPAPTSRLRPPVPAAQRAPSARQAAQQEADVTGAAADVPEAVSPLDPGNTAATSQQQGEEQEQQQEQYEQEREQYEQEQQQEQYEHEREQYEPGQASDGEEPEPTAHTAAGTVAASDEQDGEEAATQLEGQEQQGWDGEQQTLEEEQQEGQQEEPEQQEEQQQEAAVAANDDGELPAASSQHQAPDEPEPVQQEGETQQEAATQQEQAGQGGTAPEAERAEEVPQGEVDVLEPLVRPSGSEGGPDGGQEHEAAVWPEASPSPHTEPGSPAHAQMHMAGDEAPAVEVEVGQVTHQKGDPSVSEHQWQEELIGGPTGEEQDASLDPAQLPAEPAKPAPEPADRHVEL
ncbi:hypothetical protein D9Q98_006180 [Chlorella vulgaris]|uniref:Sec20 C-terminal domain-containing protein n=1 Tax=Chlorella vulgaris TaxID=3077 RepID=A0A9D4Z1A8_CHLVU|nr:hypothetical protein D9Q98_006180 [Chlorella vulgaris]